MKRGEWANSRVAANNARVWHIAFAGRREPPRHSGEHTATHHFCQR
jgi:hypothetical protein